MQIKCVECQKILSEEEAYICNVCNSPVCLNNDDCGKRHIKKEAAAIATGVQNLLTSIFED